MQDVYDAHYVTLHVRVSNKAACHLYKDTLGYEYALSSIHVQSIKHTLSTYLESRGFHLACYVHRRYQPCLFFSSAWLCCGALSPALFH